MSHPYPSKMRLLKEWLAEITNEEKRIAFANAIPDSIEWVVGNKSKEGLNPIFEATEKFYQYYKHFPTKAYWRLEPFDSGKLYLSSEFGQETLQIFVDPYNRSAVMPASGNLVYKLAEKYPEFYNFVTFARAQGWFNPTKAEIGKLLNIAKNDFSGVDLENYEVMGVFENTELTWSEGWLKYLDYKDDPACVLVWDAFLDITKKPTLEWIDPYTKKDEQQDYSSHNAKLNAIIREKERRLSTLQLSEARYGFNTPPETLIEIEDLEVEIKDLKMKL